MTWPNWRGEIAAIAACGASLNAADLELLRGRCRVVVINRAFELAPWADVLYAADGRFWQQYPAAQTFAGLKVTADAAVAKRFGLNKVSVNGHHKVALEPVGVLGHGGNGGFQALNLTLQFGARKILLLGLDLCGEHWHGAHPAPLRNPRAPTLDKWRRRLDAEAPRLVALGAEVVNCSMQSALTAYPKMPLVEAMAHFGIAERAAA